MIQLTSMRPDADRLGEFFAGLWYGDRPSGLVLHRWLRVAADPLEFLLIWEGEDAARQWVDHRFGSFGDARTVSGMDLTAGMTATLGQDLGAFEQSLAESTLDAHEVADAVEFRRKAIHAPSWDGAMELGRAWAAKQPSTSR